MKKMEGYSLDFISTKTGIEISKLKSIVSRNQELKERPFSVKAGKYRVFFDEFIEWLKKYEGVSKVSKSETNATNATYKPFLDAHEARLAAKAGLITPEEYRLIVGLDYPKPGDLEPKIARQVYAVAQKAIRSEIEKAKTESKTNYLEFK